jgi:hypothetical protein
VTVTGVALDPQSRDIQGFYLNDSGNGKSAEFVDAILIRVAWQDTGGWSVVTDAVHPDPADTAASGARGRRPRVGAPPHRMLLCCQQIVLAAARHANHCWS